MRNLEERARRALNEVPYLRRGGATSPIGRGEEAGRLSMSREVSFQGEML